jgi:hypothetical protein
VTVGKYIDNTWATAGQLLGKWVPVTTDTYTAVEVLLDYNSDDGVFCVVHAEML